MLLAPLYRVESAGPMAEPTVVDRNSLARQTPALLLVIAALVVAVWYITQWKT
jgi:hypothetical protein